MPVLLAHALPVHVTVPAPIPPAPRAAAQVAVEPVAALSAPVEGTLSRAVLEAVYEAAGVPLEWRADLATIAQCESRLSPGAVGDNGRSLGLHQIGVSRPGWQGWFRYFGVDEALAFDAVVNTRVAVLIIEYNLARGQAMFDNWTCQP